MKVFVSGMGVFNSIAHNVKQFENSLKTNICGIKSVEYLHDMKVSLPIGMIEKFSLEDSLRESCNQDEFFYKNTLKSIKRSPYVVQTAVIPAIEAWNYAQLNNSDIDMGNVGLIVGGQNISQMYHYEMFQKYREQLEYINPTYALHYMDTDCVGTLSEVFGIKGESFSVGGASATSNVAIIKGYQQIKFGINDICMVASPINHLSPLEVQAFYNLGALGGRKYRNLPKEACRPFDEDHEGFIYGQGIGVLILESEDSVKRRKVHPLVEIIGGSMVLDSNRLSAPSEDGEYLAIKKAIKEAGLMPKDITYVNAHGSSSPKGDDVEAKVIKNIFQDDLSNIHVNSTKSFTGHCLNSAGITEAIATILQMKGDFLHSNLNLHKPIDNDIPFVRNTLEHISVKYGINNSFGFGGINTCLVLKNVV
ncbi:beta-ketoacyl synthase N-terminal-like domain-containing protein [Anaeromicropila populeti]|uniref:Malonyl-ACP decarboxylase n=1 Tax=Anaeromicropila populeti TaxID=37658 RepID=A0A1I6IZY5_9FIRM|nr:beta-ketoacyl synthase N-terminal-like domain-containing protein [Anaeromicropila populeti]SFR72325.1 malonyl-ACP decarboxylase [Anaeromicropila populeti]